MTELAPNAPTEELPWFATSARELAARLDEIPEEYAEDQAKRLRAYADTFERWADPVYRPPWEERAPVLDEFASVCRRALETITR